MKKKLLCLALIACLALSLLPTAALADGEIRYGPFTCYLRSDSVIILDVDSSVSGMLTIPEQINGLPVTDSMNGAFHDLPDITEVLIPNSFRSFATADASNPFWGCTKLENIRISQSHPVFRFSGGILYSTYNGNTTVEGVLPRMQGRVVIPAVNSLKMGAFQGCDHVTDVVLPEGLQYIGWTVFNGCRGLRSIYIPDSCTWIGMAAFEDCSALTDVYFGGTEQQWSKLKQASDGSNEPLWRAAIHYRARVAGFTDVRPGDYFADPVAWAVDSGVTNGTGPAAFSPDDPCTRAQMVTFLWRAQGSPAPKRTQSAFTDVPKGAYYENAVFWAVENGVTSGTGPATFSPDATVTRAQTVTFLGRLAGSPAMSGAVPFRDVPAGEYYTTAVVWAVANGVTSGTSATTFSPDSPCTRAQIVTFLYRDLA